MKRLSILKRTACDVRTLPLGAREAFFLSQLDGRLTLEEATEISGLPLEEATMLAEKLVELGALTMAESRPPVSMRRGATEAASERRIDPRAEAASIPPGAAEKKRSAAPPDSRVEKVSMRPAPGRRPTPRPEKRRSRKSMRGMTAAPPKAAPANEVCELDKDAQAAIMELDQKILASDLYTALGVERAADKKTIKRAYFGFAAKYHPDRFFGKKLGAMRIPIERIFHRLTVANDTLTDAVRRALYDATLPPLPEPRESPPPRRASKAMRASSRQMKAAKAASIPPASARSSKAPPSARSSKAPPASRSSKAPPASRSSKAPPASRSSKAPPASRSSKAPKPEEALASTARLDKFELTNTPVVIKPIDAADALSTLVPLKLPSSSTPAIDEGLSSIPISAVPLDPAARTRQLRAAAMEIKMQSTVENLVRAAEASAQAGDVVGAANNYRLALSHREDPYLRMKFEDLDARARVVRFEKSLALAKAAERDQRWPDAATHLVRALDARLDADVAARAGNALRLAGGDLAKAVALAEQSVSLDARNVAYRIGLCEAYLAQGRISRAESALEDAVGMAPKDARLKEMASKIALQRKGSKG